MGTDSTVLYIHSIALPDTRCARLISRATKDIMIIGDGAHLNITSLGDFAPI